MCEQAQGNGLAGAEQARLIEKKVLSRIVEAEA
jgi:hypothetical protein